MYKALFYYWNPPWVWRWAWKYQESERKTPPRNKMIKKWKKKNTKQKINMFFKQRRSLLLQCPRAAFLASGTCSIKPRHQPWQKWMSIYGKICLLIRPKTEAGGTQISSSSARIQPLGKHRWGIMYNTMLLLSQNRCYPVEPRNSFGQQENQGKGASPRPRNVLPPPHCATGGKAGWLKPAWRWF